MEKTTDIENADVPTVRRNVWHKKYSREQLQELNEMIGADISIHRHQEFRRWKYNVRRYSPAANEFEDLKDWVRLELLPKLSEINSAVHQVCDRKTDIQKKGTVLRAGSILRLAKKDNLDHQEEAKKA